MDRPFRRLPILGPTVDKRAVASPDVPCLDKLPICQAVCCCLEVKLSQADVDEGVVRWDPERPYLIAHGDDDLCVHLSAQGCGVYEHRPAPCRAFDCRRDKRIWVDFEAGILNPRIAYLKLAARNHRHTPTLEEVAAMAVDEAEAG